MRRNHLGLLSIALAFRSRCAIGPEVRSAREGTLHGYRDYFRIADQPEITPFADIRAFVGTNQIYTEPGPSFTRLKRMPPESTSSRRPRSELNPQDLRWPEDSVGGQ
jgi:hypothetical protein